MDKVLTIKQMIAQGNVGEALELTFDYSQDTIYFDEVVILSRQYHDFQRNQRIGVLENDISLNKISDSLLKILNKIGGKDKLLHGDLNSSYLEIVNLANNNNQYERCTKLKEKLQKIFPCNQRILNVNEQGVNGIEIFQDELIYFFGYSNDLKEESYKSVDWQKFLGTVQLIDKNIICIYISLGSLDESIYEKAKKINFEEKSIILIDLEDWKALSKSNIKFKVFLEHMVKFRREFGLPKFSNIVDKLKSISHTTKIQELLKKQFQKQSSIFHLRFKHTFHEKIYVRREMDRRFDAIINRVRPSKLKLDFNFEESTNGNLEQICVIRDTSGSGKTTFAINTSLHFKQYFGVGITADEIGVDRMFHDFINSLGKDLGLDKITLCDKPIVFVVDSLDETSQEINKKRIELISLIRYISHLNSEARKYGFRNYPVLVVFTVREAYWRDWENVFEGRKMFNLKKTISTFVGNEFTEALSKYSIAYNYTIIDQKLNKEQSEILSIPINLQIFSEANQGKGEISLKDIWKENVIDLYFERKQNDILKRNIPGLNSKKFLSLTSAIAYYVVEKGQNLIIKKDFFTIIEKSFDSLIIYVNDILNALISDRILVEEIKLKNSYRFKHARFIEYLVAYFAVWMTYIRCDIMHLKSLTSKSLTSGLVSMFRIHEDINFICYNRFESTRKLISDYYSSSPEFLKRKLSHLRGQLANNRDSNLADIDLLLRKSSSHNSEVAWDTFFVLASKRNVRKVNPNDVLMSFLYTWKKNASKFDRWKLIVKLTNYDLLMHENVFPVILESKNYKEWEVYLGLVYINKKQEIFKEMWTSFKGKNILDMRLQEFPHKEWKNVERLADAIFNNREIILGDFDEGLLE